MNPLDLENIGSNVVLLLFQSLLRRGLLVAINFSPKVGEILECNFGNYPVSQNGPLSTT